MAIYGVTVVDEGQTMSVDDMITENIMSYMARDIVVLGQNKKAIADEKTNMSSSGGKKIKLIN
jgi:hypothetical protein